jgi:hypothetical protein
MSFFNSKEEVLDIELTRFGKLLLSRGLFKPAYYSLHDDDVLYDADYAGVIENTNYAENRIQDETPVHKPFYSFSEAKPYLSHDLDQEKFHSQKANLAIQKTSLSPNILTNSTISNTYIPSWEIYNLSSVFSSSAPTFTTKNVVSASIPQFEVNIDTTFYKLNQDILDENPNMQKLYTLQETGDSESLAFFGDDLYITLNTPLILKIIENNIDVESDLFDIEIYKVSIDEDEQEKYLQLKLSDSLNNYDSKNDLYVETRNIFLTNNSFDSSHAEYYFDIVSDQEIANIDVCKYILRSTEDQDLIFSDINVCNSLRTKLATDNLYEVTIDAATGKVC